MRARRSFPMMCGALAAVALFGAVSPEAYHCLTACGHPELSAAATSGVGCHAASRLSAEDHGPDRTAAGKCVGPSCLCHLSGLASRADDPGGGHVVFPLASHGPPGLGDLGVVGEVLHVPKRPSSRTLV